MWQTSPSIVHDEVIYQTYKQFGIDFVIGKSKKADQKEADTTVQKPAAANQVQAGVNAGKMMS